MSETPQEPAASEPRVFINYRRDDAAGYALLLTEWLSETERLGPGRVFMDVNAISPGADFPTALEKMVTTCKVMVVLIGQQWLGILHQRREEPDDFVRREIAAALARDSRDILVIPVCVEGASVPSAEDLPDELKSLARRQALKLSSDEGWNLDAERLLTTLKKHLGLDAGWWDLLRRSWEMFPVRLLAAMLILTAALAPQVYLAYRPGPVSLEATGRFSPAVAKLGREMLTIEAPSPDAEGLLLAHVANPNEIVDLGFERARLDGDTLMQFSEQNPPTSPSGVDFVTTPRGGAAAGESCRTFIQVSALDPRKPPSALHFYQQAPPGGDIQRTLEMKAGGDVLVGVTTYMPDGSDEHSPGCAKLLKVEPGFSIPVPGVSTVSVIAEAASASSFSFNPAAAKEPLWDRAEGLFRPFSFGDEGTGAVRARAVEIVALGGQAAVLSARSADGAEPLTVESLSVGSDHLQVKVSGVGFVKVNDEHFSDPLGRVRRHPLPSLLFALADAALLAWVVHLLFGRRQPSMR